MPVKNYFSEDSDQIFIEDLEIAAHVGITDGEKALLQDLKLNIILWTSLEKPGKSDRIEDALDYAEVMDAVRGQLQGKTFDLIETMAEITAQLILSRFDVPKTHVSVSKTTLPGVKSVTVSILRQKNQSKSHARPLKKKK